MVPRENSPNLVKLAWNDPCQNAGSDEDDYGIVVPNDTKYWSPFSGTYFWIPWGWNLQAFFKKNMFCTKKALHFHTSILMGLQETMYWERVI